jgi:hypothetical protein
MRWYSTSHRLLLAEMRQPSLSGGDYLLSEDDFGLHTAALSAFKFVDRKIAARRMLFDASELYRLAASRAGIIHAQIKRHGGVPLWAR